MKKRCKKIYAIYKGDKFLSVGTCDEICAELGIKQQTIYKYNSRFYRKLTEDKENYTKVMIWKNS